MEEICVCQPYNNSVGAASRVFSLRFGHTRRRTTELFDASFQLMTTPLTRMLRSHKGTSQHRLSSAVGVDVRGILVSKA